MGIYEPCQLMPIKVQKKAIHIFHMPNCALSPRKEKQPYPSFDGTHSFPPPPTPPAPPSLLFGVVSLFIYLFNF
jgi:hypothetical protein